MNNSLGKLFDVMPKELLKNLHVKTGPGVVTDQIKNYLDNEQVDEKAQIDKSDIIKLKRSLRRPKRNVFVKQKEINGMVEKFTELSVWRENLLIKHKDEKKIENAIELILHELQTRLKDKKNITNQSITDHMNKYYKHLTAFSGNANQRHKYCVQIMSKLNNALGPQKTITEGEIDNPLIDTTRAIKKNSFAYILNPGFFKHRAPTIRKVVGLCYKLQNQHKKELARAKKLRLKQAVQTINITPETIETIPEKTDLVTKSDKVEAPIVIENTTKEKKSVEHVAALVPATPLPENINGSLVVNFVLSKLDINGLINKVVDQGGAVKITSDCFEIDMRGGK